MDIAKTCLVIDSRKTEQIRLDGPALRIRMQQQSSRLFPLRRLSRIHIVGELQQGFDALIYCAEHQIPVAFFTLNGKLRCQLYFPVLENSLISHWLEHVEFDQQAQQEYDDWLKHQTLHLLACMGYRTGSIERRLQSILNQLHHACKKELGEKLYRQAMDWLEGMANAQLSQIITNLGLANQSRGKRKLMEDITPLYQLWLHHHLAKQLQKTQLNINGYTMSAFYQAQADELEYFTRRMLAQLTTRLESII
ncbi:hypothetical protein DWB84_18135 [Saccharophagus sp. K07]|uniref:CRISPR-associated endonuclease Cas1 n=1 Tax=Saccharophagus sp. K07 TaxID=2283636 RepID=UPI0016523C40|nr:CRISPR-associated endonuclease Cas1 [Saccharophagus sp. K07]MBC6907360.1 hypothetical protein [Saccharophagus sp. K07]